MLLLSILSSTQTTRACFDRKMNKSLVLVVSLVLVLTHTRWTHGTRRLFGRFDFGIKVGGGGGAGRPGYGIGDGEGINLGIGAGCYGYFCRHPVPPPAIIVTPPIYAPGRPILYVPLPVPVPVPAESSRPGPTPEPGLDPYDCCVVGGVRYCKSHRCWAKGDKVKNKFNIRSRTHESEAEESEEPPPPPPVTIAPVPKPPPIVPVPKPPVPQPPPPIRPTPTTTKKPKKRKPTQKIKRPQVVEDRRR